MRLQHLEMAELEAQAAEEHHWEALVAQRPDKAAQGVVVINQVPLLSVVVAVVEAARVLMAQMHNQQVLRVVQVLALIHLGVAQRHQVKM